MKFKFVKEVEGKVSCYTGEMVSTGDVVELSDYLSGKAMKNPNYEPVVDKQTCLGIAANGRRCQRTQTHGEYCFQHGNQSNTEG